MLLDVVGGTLKEEIKIYYFTTFTLSMSSIRETNRDNCVFHRLLVSLFGEYLLFLETF